MGARLNDNVQEALQFLALGSGLVLGARLIYLGVARVIIQAEDDPLTVCARPFHQGYLLSEPGTMVVLGLNLGGRIALALVFALLGGLILALLGSALARIARKETLPWAVGLGRVGLLLAGVWGIYAAFALPPVTTRVVKNGLVFTERAAFLGEISWPYPARTLELPWGEMTTIEARTSALRASGCGSMEEVVVFVDGSARTIAGLVPEGSDCNEAVHFARAHTRQLADLLERLRSN